MMLGTSPFMMASSTSSPPAPPTPDSWTQGTAPSSTLPRRIKYSGGQFIITGGDAGYVFTSPTGSSFSITSVSGPGGTTRVSAYNGSVHVLGRSGTSIYSSPNFSTWTTRTIPSITIQYIHYSSVFNMFYAVGDSGLMRASSDGATWLNYGTFFGGGSIFKMASGNGVAVITGAGGYVAYTTNGSTFTNVTLPWSYPSNVFVTFGSGIFTICSGGGEIFTSSNGSTWTKRVTLSSPTVDVGTVTNISDLHADDTGVVVFVGATGATSRGIYVTTNFTTYHAKESGLPSGTQIESIVKGGNTWVATGGTASNLVSYATVI